MGDENFVCILHFDTVCCSLAGKSNVTTPNCPRGKSLFSLLMICRPFTRLKCTLSNNSQHKSVFTIFPCKCHNYCITFAGTGKEAEQKQNRIHFYNIKPKLCSEVKIMFIILCYFDQPPHTYTLLRIDSLEMIFFCCQTLDTPLNSLLHTQANPRDRAENLNKREKNHSEE